MPTDGDGEMLSRCRADSAECFRLTRIYRPVFALLPAGGWPLPCPLGLRLIKGVPLAFLLARCSIPKSPPPLFLRLAHSSLSLSPRPIPSLSLVLKLFIFRGGGRERESKDEFVHITLQKSKRDANENVTLSIWDTNLELRGVLG